MSGGVDIEWMEWGDAAFARAVAEQKPIFLHIGATWCHWCHVMDQDTYTHPEVAKLLRERFVPVRVDTDCRPDLNERYNHGGWPTAAVLDAAGEVLVGRLYMPPHELLSLLRSTTDAAHRWVVAPAQPEEHSSQAVEVDTIWAAVKRAHDPYHGGFGEFEKFPHPGVAEWILDRKLRGMDDAGMLDAALRGMAEHDLFDREEGGFFRYATQENWTVPHYEKLLEDQARLLQLYVRSGRHRERAEGVVRWLLATLWSEAAGAFGGSQDADEAYYAQPRASRFNPPRVDPTVFAGWNGLAVKALCLASAAWGRPGLLATAKRVGETLLANHVRPDGSVLRSAGGVVGLLEDQAGVADGLVTLFQHTGESTWSAAAARVIGWAGAELRCAEGGYFDARIAGHGLERLARRPLFPNVGLGEAARRLSAITGDAQILGVAEYATRGAIAEAERYNFMGAAAAALKERMDHPVIVVKVSADATIRSAVLADPDPGCVSVVHTDAPAGAAMACSGAACARPSQDMSELQAAIAMLRRA